MANDASSYHDLIFVFDVLQADIAHFLLLGHVVVEPMVEDLQNEGALHAVFRLGCRLGVVILISVLLRNKLWLTPVAISEGNVIILRSLFFFILLKAAQGDHALRPFTQYLQDFDRLHLLFYIWCLLGAAGAAQAPLAIHYINGLLWCAIGRRRNNFVVLVPVPVIRVASLG